ncbi:hypothetical protein, partial [Sphingobium quisquiliarum]|uniref:hypothetical protein n=1 Tax=Sphingobium quisquiliarum TaxID=538379 RepID=UPI0004CE9A10
AKPKRTRRKKAEVAAEAEPAAAEAAPVAEPVSADVAEPAAMESAEGAEVQTEEDGASPRRGWWQRTFGQ